MIKTIKPKVTTSAIAAKLGLARSTVSMALRDHPAINEKTRSRVRRAADKLGYMPNDIAQAMVTGKTRVIGFLVDHPDREHISRMLNGVLQAADEQGFYVKIIRSYGPNAITDLVKRCVSQRLAGAICLNFSEPSLEQLQHSFDRYGIPMAMLASSFEHPWANRVISDDAMGVRQVIDHLVGLGHRHIAHICGVAYSGSMALRRKGFEQAMTDHGLGPPDQLPLLIHHTKDMDEVEAATRDMLADASNRPTAIFCATDSMAMVVTRTARSMGLRLPEDLSIVGFANLDIAKLADPPLTTIAQPFNEMGQTIIKQLMPMIEKLDSEVLTPSCHTLPTQLIIRQSTTIPNK